MDTCKKCGSENIVLIEYSWDHPQHYDGVSEIYCKDCKARIGRWTGRELHGKETEPRYGIVNN